MSLGFNDRSRYLLMAQALRPDGWVKGQFFVTQVRVGHLREDGTGETRKLATHSGRAHKLTLDPSTAAAFYSCGEDGVVRKTRARHLNPDPNPPSWCCHPLSSLTLPLPSA